MSKLSFDAAAATAAGMSYGYWKVIHPFTSEAEPPLDWPVCTHCGKRFKPFRNVRYCSDECRDEERRKQAREHYYRKKAGGKND